MPYGISSAPGIYQRVMDNMLQGIPHCVVRIDDILISGETESDHRRNLEEVFRRLDKAGLRLKLSKCTFLANEVVGHCITSQGVKPVADKVRAITGAPAPQNVTQLKSYLGMVNYYHRYLPDLSTELAPLHELLKKGTKWKWSVKQETAFQKSKDMLRSAKVLVHFDSEKELLLSCDASPYGVGAVLSHRMEDGTEHPIAYASRTLAPAEKNYSQIDKEGLGVIFGIKKFHQYLYGHSFVIFTDHKPLVGLFGENRAIPQLAADRVRRWALTLAAYSYQIRYRPGKDHSNADGLSRLPLPDQTSDVPKAAQNVFVLEHMDTTPVTVNHIRNWTRRDPVLSKVLSYVLSGKWQSSVSEEFKPYTRRRDELSVEEYCLMWGSRVVIPAQGQESLLSELHVGHSGMSRMKALARSYFWWPGLDVDIENLARDCVGCKQTLNKASNAPLHPWEYPKVPWTRSHIDFAGPFMDHLFLVVVDATTKWPDIVITKTATAEWTVSALRSIFARFGVPCRIVSDNGSQFCSEEFSDFTKKNGIKHIFSAPYHPSTNGAAERLVQSFKNSLKASKYDSGTLQLKLDQFLVTYRISPHATTGETPAKLMFGRATLTRFDLLKPDVSEKVKQKQADVQTKRGGKLREFEKGDSVQCRDYRPRQDKWLSGTITSRTGPVSYTVEMINGQTWRRHVDQIHKANSVKSDKILEEELSVPNVSDIQLRSQEVLADVTNSKELSSVNQGSESSESNDNISVDSCVTQVKDVKPKETSGKSGNIVPVRRSTRERRPPTKYEP